MKPEDVMGVRPILAAAAGALLLGTAASALADASNEPLASLYVATDEVWWDPTPQLADKSAVLTVSAPNGEVSSETFAAGDQPFYRVGADGTYNYEMYGMSIGNQVAKARPAGGSGAIDANGRPAAAVNARGPNAPQTGRGTVQSGSFSVAGGVPVDPSQQEE